MYSIKWYKDSEEMYRFVPSNTPSVMTYDVSGLKFIVNPGQPFPSLIPGTSGGSIRVSIVSTDASGEFRCEVSAEAPSFQTSKRSSQLLVTTCKSILLLQISIFSYSQFDFTHFLNQSFSSQELTCNLKVNCASFTAKKISKNTVETRLFW